MPAPDLRARYVALIERLGEEMGKPVGWRRRVAEQLGIDESTLSKILSGKRVVGWDLADRAIQRLKLNRDYFSGAPEAAAAPYSTSEIEALIAKFDSGRATTKDVYALARAVMEDPLIAQASAILDTKSPKSEQQIGALFVAASKLIESIRSRRTDPKKPRSRP